jgi:hypothetical protein
MSFRRRGVLPLLAARRLGIARGVGVGARRRFLGLLPLAIVATLGLALLPVSFRLFTLAFHHADSRSWHRFHLPVLLNKKGQAWRLPFFIVAF